MKKIVWVVLILLVLYFSVTYSVAAEKRDVVIEQKSWNPWDQHKIELIEENGKLKRLRIDDGTGNAIPSDLAPFFRGVNLGIEYRHALEKIANNANEYRTTRQIDPPIRAVERVTDNGGKITETTYEYNHASFVAELTGVGLRVERQYATLPPATVTSPTTPAAPAPELEVEPEAEIEPFATEESDEDVVGKIIPPHEAPFFRDGDSIWATYARTAADDVNPEDLHRYYISKPNDKQVSPTSPQNLPPPAPQREASRQFFVELFQRGSALISSIFGGGVAVAETLPSRGGTTVVPGAGPETSTLPPIAPAKQFELQETSFEDERGKKIVIKSVGERVIEYEVDGNSVTMDKEQFLKIFEQQIAEQRLIHEASEAARVERERQERAAEEKKKTAGEGRPEAPKPVEASLEGKDFEKDGKNYHVIRVFKVEGVEFVEYEEDGERKNMRKDTFLNEKVKDAKLVEKGKEVAPGAKPEAPKAEAKPDFKKIIDTLFGDKKQFDTKGGTNYKIQEKDGKYVLTITRPTGTSGPEELKDLTAEQLVEKLKEEGVRIAEPAEAITEPPAEAAKGTFETAGATTVLDRADFEKKLRESGIPPSQINNLANTYMQRRDLTKLENLNYELGTFKAGDKHRVVQIVLGAIVIAEDEDIIKARATAKARAEKHLLDNKDNNIKFNYLQYGRDTIEQVYGFKGGNLEHSKPTYHYKGKDYELKDLARNLFKHESADGYRELRIMEGHGSYELDVKTKDGKPVDKEITFYTFKNGRRVEVDSFEDDPEKQNDAFDKASNADPTKALQRRDFLIKALPLLQEAGVDFEDEKTIIEGGRIFNVEKGVRLEVDLAGRTTVMQGKLFDGGSLDKSKDYTITRVRPDNKLEAYTEQRNGRTTANYEYYHNAKGELEGFGVWDTLRLPEISKSAKGSVADVFGTPGASIFPTKFKTIKTPDGKTLVEIVPPITEKDVQEGKKVNLNLKVKPGIYANYGEGLHEPFGKPEFLDKDGNPIDPEVRIDKLTATDLFYTLKGSAEKYVNQLGTTLLKIAVAAGRGALGVLYIGFKGLPGVLSYYNQFKGLAAYGSLFGVEEWAPGWKEEVNNVFCNTVLLSELSKCPQSAICSRYSDVGGRSGSIVITSPPFAGTPQAGIHLEAEKSKPVTFFNATSKKNEQLVLYKVTYSLTNTGTKSMNYNLEFKGETTAKWFPEDKQLSEGQSDGRRPSDPLLKYSKADYSQICLGFSPKLRTFSGKRIGHFCADITEYKGDATRPYTPQTAETQTQPTETGAAPTAPQQPPGEGESV